MKKLLLTMFTVVFVLNLFIIPVSAQTTSNVINVNDYHKLSDSDYTDAINRAHAVLKETAGGILLFPAKDYKISPNSIFIPSNVTWLGEDGARLYTEETDIYNVLISTENQGHNITIDNLIIDQSNDATLEPLTGEIFKGAILLHVPNSTDVTIKNSTFYTYGVCAVLVQSYDIYRTEFIELTNNKVYFERKVDNFYDVSLFNIDGRTVNVIDNYFEAIQVEGFSYSEPRTAMELHMPNGTVNGNASINVETGILHLGWPVNWTNFEDDHEGEIEISNNTIEEAIIGINLWSTATSDYSGTKNVTIEYNTINLKLDAYNTPAKGISLSEGDANYGFFRNIRINNNTIGMTTSDAYTEVINHMNLVIPSDKVGALHMNVSATITDLEVMNNTINNFPYSAINIFSKSGLHKNIMVYGNEIYESSYINAYGDRFNSVINVGNVENITIDNNYIQNYQVKINSEYDEYNTVNNIIFTNNEFDVVDEALVAEQETLTISEDLKLDYNGVLGFFANGKQIYVTNPWKLTAGDIIKTPNNELSMISSVSGNYMYLQYEVEAWSNGKLLYGYDQPEVVEEEEEVIEEVIEEEVIEVIEEEAAEVVIEESTTIEGKVYENVLGFFANGKQIYITNAMQVSVNDVILTPNNEKAIVERVSGNYMFLETSVASWVNGQLIRYAGIDAIVSEEPNAEPDNIDIEEEYVPDEEKVYENVLGFFANGKQIYITNAMQVSVNDVILTPNNEKAIVERVSGNYMFLETSVASWVNGQLIRYAGIDAIVSEESNEEPDNIDIEEEEAIVETRIYNSVVGTWANSKQIYVTNQNQCKDGDVIITPNGERAKVRRAASNYLFLETEVSNWYGGVYIKLAE